MKKRYFQSRPKSLPKGYDSKLELRLHENSLKGTQHHVPKEDRIPYFVEHTYEPDFLFEHKGTFFVIECKGRFRDASEKSKYLWIRKRLKEWHVFTKSNCTDIELVLLFENAATAMPFAKARKDGTKLSHGEWATKEGFRWLCEKRGDLLEVKSRQDLVNKLEELCRN